MIQVPNRRAAILTVRLRLVISLIRLVHTEATMTETIGVPGARILSFIERIEQLEIELQELNGSKRRSSQRPRARAST